MDIDEGASPDVGEASALSSKHSAFGSASGGTSGGTSERPDATVVEWDESSNGRSSDPLFFPPRVPSGGATAENSRTGQHNCGENGGAGAANGGSPRHKDSHRRLRFSRPIGPSKEVGEVKDGVRKMVQRFRGGTSGLSPATSKTSSGSGGKSPGNRFLHSDESAVPTYLSPDTGATVDWLSSTAPQSEGGVDSSAGKLACSSNRSLAMSYENDESHREPRRANSDLFFSAASAVPALPAPISQRPVALTQFLSPLPVGRTVALVGRLLTQSGCEVAVKRNNYKMKVQAAYGTSQVLHASISVEANESEGQNSLSRVTIMRSKDDKGRTEVQEFVNFHHSLNRQFDDAVVKGNVPRL